MNKSVFQVNLSGILQVLSDSLYSNWEVFIRELLQNANDATIVRKNKEKFDPKVQIDFFKNEHTATLIVKDNGIGLSAEEMVEFLSKIGSSSKRNPADLIDNNQNSFIGQFGIGLLSCFMVSDTIEVVSTNSSSAKTMKWHGNSDGTYDIEEIEFNEVIGSYVKLVIKPSIPLDNDKLVFLLHKYGDYLPIPIHYSYNLGHETVFNRIFPWDEKSNFGNEALLLGNSTFNEKFNYYFPIKTLDGQTEGIAYILPKTTYTTNQSNHVLYIKKMFINDSCEDVLPDWAFFLKAIINSNTLSTTASREDVYHNDQLEQVKYELGQSIIHQLVKLSETHGEVLNEIMLTHGQALKAMALEDDDFFNLMGDWFIFPTTEGHLSITEIKQKTKKILFVSDIDEFRQISPIATANKQLLINAGYIYDTPILLKMAENDHHNRISMIDPEYFGNILKDIEVEEYDRNVDNIDLMQRCMIEFDVQIEVKTFEPATLPALYYMSQENIEKRDFENIKNESDDTWAGITNSIIDFSPGFKSKLFLNFNNEIVHKLILNATAKDLNTYLQMIYFNALLMGHYQMTNKELARMNENLLLMINKNI